MNIQNANGTAFDLWPACIVKTVIWGIFNGIKWCQISQAAKSLQINYYIIYQNVALDAGFSKINFEVIRGQWRSETYKKLKKSSISININYISEIIYQEKAFIHIKKFRGHSRSLWVKNNRKKLVRSDFDFHQVFKKYAETFEIRTIATALET